MNCGLNRYLSPETVGPPSRSIWTHRQRCPSRLSLTAFLCLTAPLFGQEEARTGLPQLRCMLGVGLHDLIALRARYAPGSAQKAAVHDFLVVCIFFQ